LADLVTLTSASLYAWALMPNHAHILLRTGELPLSQLVHRWLSQYVTRFNLIHRRAGHLFQNRFKNILVEEDGYLLELVRYIHLNPVRSRLPVTIASLDEYPWTGHSVLLGNADLSAQDVDHVLAHFGDRVGPAREAYRRFVREGAQDENPPDLEGGGLRRSVGGGWELVAQLSRGREKWSFDERILGGSAFVDAVLSQSAQGAEGVAAPPRDSLEEVVDRVATQFSITFDELRSASLRQCVLDARAFVSHIAVNHYGLTRCEAGRFLRVSRQSVARALLRVPEVADRTGIEPSQFIVR
jgi:putative transposase